MECRVCHNELNDSNWNPSTKKFHSYICKKCDSQKKKAYYQLHKKESFEKGKQYRINNREKVNINGRNWRRRFRIGTRDLAGNKILIKCIKRPHTLICELCGEKAKRTVYHHWDDLHPEWGMWICNICHLKAEAVENINFTKQYIILKEKIIEDLID